MLSEHVMALHAGKQRCEATWFELAKYLSHCCMCRSVRSVTGGRVASVMVGFYCVDDVLVLLG